MYNRYVPGQDGYTRVVVDEEPAQKKHTAQTEKRHTNGMGKTQDLLRNLTSSFGMFDGMENKNAGIAGILKGLHLEGVDSGDVLLLLIILLVFLEGDNTELVITLGLMLLLGLGDQKE